MIRYHRQGTLKSQPISRMNAQEHLDFIQETIFIDYNGCHYPETVAEVGGYPKIRHRGKMIKITRLLAAMEKGCEVADLNGMNDSYAHTCSNKACVNPAHGRVVSHKENCHDGDRGKVNTVWVRAENEDNIRLFPSIRDADRAGFKHSSVSVASRGVLNKYCKHGGTHSYKGYMWSRIEVK